MLPKDLLEVRKLKGRILPKFADKSDYKLAEKIIKIFKAGEGKKYGLILSAIKSLENAHNYKKVRGFAKVMENLCNKTCIFSNSQLSPVEVRMFLFERGYVTSKEERRNVMEQAAKYFNSTVEEIEKVMFADREEELILSNVKQVTPDELIKLYNLSLLQTTLFNALRLTFWISSNHKEVFRKIKWLGLMYELYEEEKNGESKILAEITGTASILKMTRKYGTAMAKLIPSIIKAEKWWIRAEIIDDNRIYKLEIDDAYKHLLPKYEERIDYDSSLEERFARKIKAIKPEIEIIREPGLIKAGKYAFIPDFLIKRKNKKVYVEIVGFWTSEYIKKKIRKIKDVNIPLIVIIREDYGDKIVDLDNVILFSKTLPYNEIIKKINEFLKGDINDIRFEDVINLRKLSNELNIPLEKIMNNLPNGYIIACNYAIKEETFNKIKKEIEEIKPHKLSEVLPILQKYNLGYDILEFFGYKVKWIGLSEDDALIER